MSQRIRTKTKKNRTVTFAWIFGLALLVSLLIYFEQTALLYIFSTVGVTVLLIIVATADLGRSELGSGDPVESAKVAGSARPTK